MKITTRKQQARVERRITPTYQALVAALMAVYIPQVYGDTPFNGVIEENFSGNTTNNKWLMPLPGDGIKNPWDPSSPSPTVVNSACLTAGTGTTKPTATSAGSPPGCTGINKDDPGKGVLRLTPAQNQVVGGIVSDFTFGTQEGVEITFITYTWGGTGADGMTFFLADGSKPATLGASGGSIGYSCTNENPIFSGVYGGYMGIGIDEWGNFVFRNDNTTTGAPSLGQRLPNTIGIRGAGSINHTYISKHLLQEIYTKFGWGTVPSSVQNNWTNLWTSKAGFGPWAINAPSYRRFVNVCKTGQLTIDSAYLPAGRSSIVLSDRATDPRLKLYNYQYFAHKQLSRRFATESARSRDQSVPMLYKIRITPNGKASVWISYNGGEFQPVMTDFDIVAANGPLPKSFRFGFMGATGGAHNKCCASKLLPPLNLKVRQT